MFNINTGLDSPYLGMVYPPIESTTTSSDGKIRLLSTVVTYIFRLWSSVHPQFEVRGLQFETPDMCSNLNPSNLPGLVILNSANGLLFGPIQILSACSSQRLSDKGISE